MTKKEAIQILAILKAAYPASYNGMTKEEAAGTVGVWCLQFADMPADIVMMAIQKLISSSKFPPAISEVKNKIVSIHWEAYEVVSNKNTLESISEEKRQRYLRIYELTKGYKVSGIAEPGIDQIMSHSKPLALQSGE